MSVIKDMPKLHLTSVKAIREYCMWCCCGQSTEVKLCPSMDCVLHALRLQSDKLQPKGLITKAITKKCKECSGEFGFTQSCIKAANSDKICPLIRYRYANELKDFISKSKDGKK